MFFQISVSFSSQWQMGGVLKVIIFVILFTATNWRRNSTLNTFPLKMSEAKYSNCYTNLFYELELPDLLNFTVLSENTTSCSYCLVLKSKQMYYFKLTWHFIFNLSVLDGWI